jgi:hypothetical protein
MGSIGDDVEPAETGSARSLASTSSPDMPGMLMSSNTMSKGLEASLAERRAVLASSVKPSRFTKAIASRRLMALSSTTRTFLLRDDRSWMNQEPGPMGRWSGEGRPFADTGFDGQLTAQQMGELPGQGQAQAGATVIAGRTDPIDGISRR